MRASLAFVREKFSEYNSLCFGGELPELPIRMNNSRSALGLFVHPRVYPDSKPRGVGECHIRISTRLDMPREEIEDTIIHEMIHYFIWYRRIKDTSPHGRYFRMKMDEINRLHGRRLSISYAGPRDVMDTDIHRRNNYICITHWDDGSLGITVCGQTKIFEIHRGMSGVGGIRNIEWFWSNDPWFNRFPLVRTLKVIRLSYDDYKAHVLTSMPCSCDGKTFQPKK